MEDGDDRAAEIAAAEAEYAVVFANDGRSRAALLKELDAIGDEIACPEIAADDDLSPPPPPDPPASPEPPAGPRIRTLKDESWD